MRRCGECSLCCRLLPMQVDGDKSLRRFETIQRMVQVGMIAAADAENITPDFSKPAGCKCPHQRHNKGCAIYDRRPIGCRLWNCRWLVNDDCDDLARPDRCHYVIDISPDFVTRTYDDGSEPEVIPVVQVWCDKRWPNAYKNPKLLAYLERRGKEGHAALIRLSSNEAFVLFPPSMTGGEWVEKHSEKGEAEHTMEEKLAALGDIKISIR